MRHDWVRAPAVSIPRPTGGVYLVEVIGAGELEVRGAVGLGFSARRYLAPAEAGPHAAGRHMAWPLGSGGVRACEGAPVSKRGSALEIANVARVRVRKAAFGEK